MIGCDQLTLSILYKTQKLTTMKMCMCRCTCICLCAEIFIVKFNFIHFIECNVHWSCYLHYFQTQTYCGGAAHSTAVFPVLLTLSIIITIVSFVKCTRQGNSYGVFLCSSSRVGYMALGQRGSSSTRSTQFQHSGRHI